MYAVEKEKTITETITFWECPNCGDEINLTTWMDGYVYGDCSCGTWKNKHYSDCRPRGRKNKKLYKDVLKPSKMKQSFHSEK